jgi:hypothetical protein
VPYQAVGPLLDARGAVEPRDLSSPAAFVSYSKATCAQGIRELPIVPVVTANMRIAGRPCYWIPLPISSTATALI